MGASRQRVGRSRPAVAGYTTAVVYDRSGLGRSPRDPAPARPVPARRRSARPPRAPRGRSVRARRSQLGRTDRARRRGPGTGPASRVSCWSTRPTRAATSSSRKANQRQVRISTPLLPMLARLGIMRIAVRRFAAQLPEPAATAMRAEDGSTAASRTLQAEVVAHTDDLRTLRDAPPVLPDVPVTLISGTLPSRLERGRRGELIKAHRERGCGAAGPTCHRGSVRPLRPAHGAGAHRRRGVADRRQRRDRTALTHRAASREGSRCARRRVARGVRRRVRRRQHERDRRHVSGERRRTRHRRAPLRDDHVDEPPQRIVSLDNQWTDVLVALDAPLVGAALDPVIHGRYPWQDVIPASVESIPVTDSIPYEAVAALQPDLIVITWAAPDAETYDLLSEIAADHSAPRRCGGRHLAGHRDRRGRRPRDP